MKGYGPAIGWALLILIVSVLPSDYIPKPPNWGLSFDKLVHFGLFAILSVLTLMGNDSASRQKGTSRILALSVILILYGLLTEAVQIYVPNRNFSLADLGADGLGVLIGSLFFNWYHKR